MNLKHTLAIFRASFLTVLLTLAPATYAQAPSTNGQPINRLGAFLNQFIYLISNILVPLIFALAFVVFIYGIFQYFILGGANEEKRDTGKQLMIWGFIGFFVMVSVWGILNLLTGSFGLNNDTRPDLPTFNQKGSANQGAPTASGLPTAGDASGFPSSPPTLRRGDTGESVKHLQQLLGVPVDGIYGPQTEQAVRDYQKSHTNLTVDGVAGAQTWGSLSRTGGASSQTQTSPTQTGANQNKPSSLPSCLTGQVVCGKNDVCTSSGECITPTGYTYR